MHIEPRILSHEFWSTAHDIEADNPRNLDIRWDFAGP
jgi:hypothetical protein